ncbi:hypothetical protein [Shinella sp.]|uniref:hypothetical protein n=1 Tax=Shinella sp. TaxID=1870904 RepID=UPI0039E4D8E9
MTYELEIQVLELQAEMNVCIDPAEHRQIAAELEVAQAELAVIIAEQDGAIDAEPPF